LRIVVLKTIPEDSSLSRGWNALVPQMEQPQIVYRIEWALAVQSAYGATLRPLLFLGYDGDDLVGVACLATDVAEQTVSFLTATTGDYCDFVAHPRHRAEFVNQVFAELRQLGLCNLTLANLPAESATLSAFQNEGKNHGFHAYLRPAYSCPRVDLGFETQRQELQTTVSRKRQLRRCMKALEREATVTFSYLRTWPEIQAELPAFFDAHSARFRAKQGVSFLSTSERQHFMEDLARRFSATGDITLSILRIGDRPIAWSFGFQAYGSWFLYQTTFDIRCQENSPGYCLIARIIIEACAMTSLHVVDLGLGAEAYKEWFANGARQTLHATLTTSSLRHLQGIARHRIAAEIKRFPKVETVIRNARSRLLPGRPLSA
jgi:CelD/BcsL family acetyltransferase involved in cellulose biosynthesis